MFIRASELYPTNADGRGDLSPRQANKPESKSSQNTESNRLKADRYERFISAMRQRLGAVSLRPATHSSAASLAVDVYTELRCAEPKLFKGITEWKIEEQREQLSRVYALHAAPMERVQSLVRARESRFVSDGRLEDTIRELRSFHSSASPSAKHCECEHSTGGRCVRGEREGKADGRSRGSGPLARAAQVASEWPRVQTLQRAEPVSGRGPRGTARPERSAALLCARRWR